MLAKKLLNGRSTMAKLKKLFSLFSTQAYLKKETELLCRRLCSFGVYAQHTENGRISGYHLFFSHLQASILRRRFKMRKKRAPASPRTSASAPQTPMPGTV